MEKKKRGKNFTDREKEYAVSIINRYKVIVDGKSSDSCSLKERKNAWEQIAKEFNSISMFCPRSGPQLKIFYFNLKRVARKRVLAGNKNIYLQEEADEFKKEKIDDESNSSLTDWSQYNSQIANVESNILAITPQATALINGNHQQGPTVSLKQQNGFSSQTGITSIPEPITVPAPSLNKSTIFQKNRMKYKKVNTSEDLKRIFLLKKIRLVNMEICHKKQMYALELKIKRRELKNKCSK